MASYGAERVHYLFSYEELKLTNIIMYVELIEIIH